MSLDSYAHDRMHYGVTSGLECFGSDPGEGRFRALREALAGRPRTDADRLIEAARVEIWEHVAFWDDVYYAILAVQDELAA